MDGRWQCCVRDTAHSPSLPATSTVVRQHRALRIGQHVDMGVWDKLRRVDDWAFRQSLVSRAELEDLAARVARLEEEVRRLHEREN